MQNILADWLDNHNKTRILTSSETTYDKMVHDKKWNKMYLDNSKGIFRPLTPQEPINWQKKVFIELYKDKISKCGINPVVLDIGSGSGYPSISVCDIAKKVYSVDFSKELQKIAKKNILEFEKKNIEVVHARGENLPFEDNVFDCVIASHFIEFSKDANKCMQEISRVLKKGGSFVSLTSNWDMALNSSFGYLDGERILYPALRAEKVSIKGVEYLKYRVCSKEPMLENTYYVLLGDNEYIDVLVKIINNGYLNLAIETLNKIEIKQIDNARCHQYNEKSIVNLFNDNNFAIESMHGVRIPIYEFIKKLMDNKDFDFSFFEKNYELLSKEMINIVRTTSPILGFDMFISSINNK